jgi:Arc/MetJ-type ribon-helix-helix transcriptional regulator
MTTMQLHLPDELARELETLVTEGWFESREEALRTALTEFLRRHRRELIEKCQEEDIAWALRHKGQAT